MFKQTLTTVAAAISSYVLSVSGFHRFFSLFYDSSSSQRQSTNGTLLYSAHPEAAPMAPAPLIPASAKTVKLL
jgi:hypothetical protein